MARDFSSALQRILRKPDSNDFLKNRIAPFLATLSNSIDWAQRKADCGHNGQKSQKNSCHTTPEIHCFREHRSQRLCSTFPFPEKIRIGRELLRSIERLIP
jgi:hypothetical protein